MGFCSSTTVDTGSVCASILGKNMNNDSIKYVDSGLVLDIEAITQSTKVSPSLPKTNPVKFDIGTAEWLAHTLRTVNMLRAIGELATWMPNNQQQEANEQVIHNVGKLEFPDAIEAVKSFKRKQKFIRGTKGKDLKFTVIVENTGNGIQVESDVLVDCGATRSCVNKKFVEKHGLPIRSLSIKMPVYNADGTLNAGGSIEGFVDIRMVIGDHAEKIELAITDLGNIDIFLGLDWLRFHNPSVDWTESTIVFDRCPARCGYIPWWSSPEEGETLNCTDSDNRLFMFYWEAYIKQENCIRSVHEGSNANPYIEAFPLVFNKEGFDTLPERRPWDHAIELIDSSKPLDCKVYPLNLSEQKALEKFLEENLRSRQI